MKLRSRDIALCALLALLTATAGCRHDRKAPISEDRMVEILTDMQLAQAYTSTSQAMPGDLNRERMMEAVLKKHGVTGEELDSAISYYGRNIDEYYSLYEKVEKNLRGMTGKEIVTNEDDIWPYGQYAALFPNQMSNGIIFSIPANDIEKGNTLDWKMRLTSSENVELTLGVEYDDGSYSIYRKNASGTPEISLITDTALTVKRIFGSLNTPANTMPVWADSIRLIKTEFDSLNYYRIRHQKRIYPPRSKPVKKDTDSVKSPEPSLHPGE